MVNMFIRPHFMWEAPLLEPAPKHFEIDLRRAITRTKSNWHCNARWWAERLACHPHYAPDIQAMKVLLTDKLPYSNHLGKAAQQHADVLGLRLHYDDTTSRWSLAAKAGDDQRVEAALSRAVSTRGQPDAPSEEVCMRGPLNDADLHALRVVARVRLFNGVEEAQRHRGLQGRRHSGAE